MSRLQQFLFSALDGPARLPGGDQLESLQHYLHNFGFLHLAGSPPVMGAAPTGDLPRATLGVPNQDTVEALQHFQSFFKLDDTGKLDPSTVAKLNLPRCGVPERQDEGKPAARDRVVTNPWGKQQLTYSFLNSSKKMTQSQLERAFRMAFRLWSDVCELSFQQVAQGGDITIQFFAPDEPGYIFDGPFGTLALTYFPRDGRAQFDDDENWTALNVPTEGTANGIDLVSVAAHEIGHALGLDHSNDTASLMYPIHDGPHRSLSRDDIARIQGIYNKKSDDEPIDA